MCSAEIVLAAQAARLNVVGEPHVKFSLDCVGTAARLRDVRLRIRDPKSLSWTATRRRALSLDNGNVSAATSSQNGFVYSARIGLQSIYCSGNISDAINVHPTLKQALEWCSAFVCVSSSTV
jgi:hypothetical protein